MMMLPPGHIEPVGHMLHVPEAVAPTAVEYVPAEHILQKSEELDPRLVL